MRNSNCMNCVSFSGKYSVAFEHMQTIMTERKNFRSLLIIVNRLNRLTYVIPALSGVIKPVKTRPYRENTGTIPTPYPVIMQVFSGRNKFSRLLTQESRGVNGGGGDSK